MSEQEPQIIELEPETAPRTSAIILLVCGLMGVGFLMVNVFFTGEDPFQSTSWPEEDDGNIQEQGNILPNVWRGRGEDDEEEEVDDQIKSRKTPTKNATTNPFAIPGYEQFMKRPSLPVPPQTPGQGAGSGQGAKPGAPGAKPAVPGSATPPPK